MRRCGLEKRQSGNAEEDHRHNVDRILMIRARKAKEEQERQEKMRNTA